MLAKFHSIFENHLKVELMSRTKNALLRYQILDKCFRNPGRTYFIEDLLEECRKALHDYDGQGEGIRERQLYDDIRFMESEQGWSAPIIRRFSGKKKYYRYEDISFSINNQPLNETEIQQLKSALQTLYRVAATPHLEWIEEIILKLETRLGLIKKEKPIISFSENPYLKGLQFLTPLFNSILNERVLLIDYKDFKNERPHQFEFHPAYLKQYNNRWFVIGYNPAEASFTWILAIDRIESMKEIAVRYRKSEIDYEDYYDDIIGITKPLDGRIEEIRLRFEKEAAPYVYTKPLHSSQKLKKMSDSVEVTIKVIPNYELESQLLAFGEHVSVISPDWFREKLRSRLSKLFRSIE